MKLAVIEHLMFKGAPPPEYVELVLCRDVYHCTPDELGAIDLDTVIRHQVCMAAENYVRENQ